MASAIKNDTNFDLEVTAPYQKEVEPEMEEFAPEGEEEEQPTNLEGKLKIEDAGFSPRTTNALVNAGIKTIAGLKRLSPLKIEEIKGLGKKGIDEIMEKIK